MIHLDMSIYPTIARSMISRVVDAAAAAATGAIAVSIRD